jgi:hypothetical protein
MMISLISTRYLANVEAWEQAATNDYDVRYVRGRASMLLSAGKKATWKDAFTTGQTTGKQDGEAKKKEGRPTVGRWLLLNHLPSS